MRSKSSAVLKTWAPIIRWERETMLRDVGIVWASLLWMKVPKRSSALMGCLLSKVSRFRLFRSTNPPIILSESSGKTVLISFKFLGVSKTTSCDLPDTFSALLSPVIPSAGNFANVSFSLSIGAARKLASVSMDGFAGALGPARIGTNTFVGSSSLQPFVTSLSFDPYNCPTRRDQVQVISGFAE